MTGPKLQPWQREYVPTEQERVHLARRFATERHVPKRSCLGCGGSMPDHWYGQCWGWGVEAWRSLDRMADGTMLVEGFRLSWAEVARLRTADGVQQELAL